MGDVVRYISSYHLSKVGRKNKIQLIVYILFLGCVCFFDNYYYYFWTSTTIDYCYLLLSDVKCYYIIIYTTDVVVSVGVTKLEYYMYVIGNIAVFEFHQSMSVSD